jgi:hypothetical protein
MARWRRPLGRVHVGDPGGGVVSDPANPIASLLDLLFKGGGGRKDLGLFCALLGRNVREPIPELVLGMNAAPQQLCPACVCFNFIEGDGVLSLLL